MSKWMGMTFLHSQAGVMSKEFMKWLRKQSHRDDPTGDLAGDVLTYERALKRKKYLDYKDLKNYLFGRTRDIDVRQSLFDSWFEFSGHLDPEDKSHNSPFASEVEDAS